MPQPVEILPIEEVTIATPQQVEVPSMEEVTPVIPQPIEDSDDILNYLGRDSGKHPPIRKY